MCKNQVAEISTKRVGNVRNQFAFCIILIQFICVHYSYFSNKIILQYFFTGACWVFFSWDILVSQLTVGYTAIINSIFNSSSHDLRCNRSRKKVHLAQSFLLPQPVLGFYQKGVQCSSFRIYSQSCIAQGFCKCKMFFYDLMDFFPSTNVSCPYFNLYKLSQHQLQVATQSCAVYCVL